MYSFLCSSEPSRRPRRKALFLVLFFLLSVCMASPALGARLMLEWDQVSDSDVHGYRIYYGTSSRDYANHLDVADPSRTQVTVSGLEMDTKYYFAAVSYNTNQESDYSSEVTHTITDGDGDGLSNYDETHFYSTDPDAPDTDGDGLGDSAELEYWKNRDGTTWDGDIDGDNTINLLDPDSDGDGLLDGTELDRGLDPTSSDDGLRENMTMTSDIVAVNHQWSSYELAKDLADPVIVAGPLSQNEVDPSVVRIRNATSQGFEIRLQEYPYLDGTHAIEAVTYLALEPGIYQPANGTMVEAGRFATDASGDGFHSVTFTAPFSQAPVVVTSVESPSTDEAVAGRIRNVTTSGFEYQLQEQEGSDQAVGSQSVAYVAWTPSSGTIDNTTYEIGRTNEPVTDTWLSPDFANGLSEGDILLAKTQTRNDADTSALRWKSENATHVRLRVQEERSADEETTHSGESIGYMTFETIPTETQTMLLGATPDADAGGALTDTFININDSVNVSSNRLNTYTWPENTPANAILLKADLSGLPEEATIQSATLELYQTDPGGDAAYEVSAHRIINHDPVLASSTGYTYDGSSSWTANDIAYNSIPLAQEDIAEAESVRSLDQSSGRKSWDITEMVRTWEDNPKANFGMLLNSDDSAASDSYRSFASSEASDASIRPEITVTYSYPISPDSDRDDDGLTYSEESETYGTDPDLADSDGDGLDDGQEVLDLGTDPLSADTDGDGLSDGEEVRETGTDPANPDSDGDGLRDRAEIDTHSTDPLAADTDSDGLNDGAEVQSYNSDPTLADTDDDGVNDGDEVAQGSDPTVREITSPSIARGEIAVDHQWERVELDDSFSDPVIVAGPMTHKSDDPGVIRVRNMTSSGFEIRVDEYEYLDESHGRESAGYLVMEKGRFRLNNATNVETGSFRAGSTYPEATTVSFGSPMGEAPVVLTSVVTDNESQAVIGRVWNVTREGFDFALQEEEAGDGRHVTETVHYVAWEPSAKTLGDLAYEAVGTGYSVSDESATFSFDSTYEREPVLLGGMLTSDGRDTANLRLKSKSETSTTVFIDEEQSSDTETSHVTEEVGYLALSTSQPATPTMVFGDTPDADAKGTLTDTFINIDDSVNVSSNRLNTYTWPENTPANAVLLKADLSGLPEGAVIQSATLELYQTDAGGDAAYEVSAHRIINHDPVLASSTGYTYDGSSSWTANDIAYNGIPLAQEDIAEAESVRSLDQSSGRKSWDITEMVRTWADNPKANFGVLLNSDNSAASDSHRFFASTQASDATLRPRLVVEYSVETTETRVLGHSSSADSTASMRDTFININRETSEASPRLNTYTWPEDAPANAALIKCDMSWLPEGATIQSAALKLYQTDAGGDATYEVSAHRIINHDPVLASSTGYTFDGSSSWTANDIAYNGIPLAQEDIATAESTLSLDQSAGLKSWDVTEMVRTWADNPEANFGVLLNSDDSAASDSYRSFASSEATDESKRPRLEITYTK